MSRPSLEGRRLYLCTPDREDLTDFVAASVAGGVDIVQLREKHLEARSLIARADELARCCRDLGVPFILNDRPDLAKWVDADGVHVGQEDAPAALARDLVGPDRIVGLSTHASAELDRALAEPISYLSAGPVVETPTKPGRPATGLAYLAEAAASCAAREQGPLPLFVTGGVTPDTVPALWRAGARGFVVVRYLTEAAAPRRAARELVAAIEAAAAS